MSGEIPPSLKYHIAFYKLPEGTSAYLASESDSACLDTHETILLEYLNGSVNKMSGSIFPPSLILGDQISSIDFVSSTEVKSYLVIKKCHEIYII